ncbi:hypothetical protein KEM55_001072 [Ascosphaera atra]|nr:hypothetical protein KEM55_001072 [Ascosphaera atra]
MSNYNSSSYAEKGRSSTKNDDDDAGEELGGYISHVYQEMSSLSRESSAKVDVAVENLEQIIDRVKAANEISGDELATLIRDVKTLKGAVMSWAALFYGAYSSLTSDSAAVEATSTVISPIITTRLTKLPEASTSGHAEHPGDRQYK